METTTPAVKGTNEAASLAVTTKPSKRPYYIDDGMDYPFSTETGVEGTYRPMLHSQLRQYYAEYEVAQKADKQSPSSDQVESIIDKHLQSQIISWNVIDRTGSPVPVSEDALNRIGKARNELVAIVLGNRGANSKARKAISEIELHGKLIEKLNERYAAGEITDEACKKQVAEAEKLIEAAELLLANDDSFFHEGQFAGN